LQKENHAVTTSPLGRVDYADTYSVALPEPMDAPRLCSMILQSAPRWLDLLLSARDKVVGPLGFSTQERNCGQPVRLSVGGTTEVQFLDTLGRAYFALVKPFHKRLIPALVSAPFPARARL
jgi:hypothetical protein